MHRGAVDPVLIRFCTPLARYSLIRGALPCSLLRRATPNPAEPYVQYRKAGQFWTPIEGQFWTPIDIDALVVSPAANLDPVKLVTLAARHAVPAIYAQRADADAGGLLSYGSLPNWRAPQQTGEGAGKIPAGSPLIRSLRGRWLQPHPDLAKDYERTRLLPLT